MPRKKKQHTKGLGDFLLCRYGAVLFYIKMQRSKVQIFMNAENGREEAKRKFLVGDSVIVLENTKKEKGLIIERKEKVRGNTKLGFICRLKLLSGQTKWVPETSLSRETAEVMCEFIEPYGVLPKIHLAPSLWIALGEDQKNVQISKNREEKCAEDTSNGHKEQRVSERHVLQRTSAEKVLLLFYQSQIELKPQAVEEVKEAVQGLKDLFVLAVHKTILYKEEREAYVASKLRPEQILETYTGMHVLRMLASLDSLGGLIGVNAEIAEHITEYAKLLAGFLEDMLTKEGK
ncbi:hypothetical protein NECID01_1092 [Nematocida sp. AWRm77]|nr:hypothetical protein NECID01_1092 [Nematocida sp. AWRm77]